MSSCIPSRPYRLASMSPIVVVCRRRGESAEPLSRAVDALGAAAGFRGAAASGSYSVADFDAPGATLGRSKTSVRKFTNSASKVLSFDNTLKRPIVHGVASRAEVVRYLMLMKTYAGNWLEVAHRS